jgi:hypothetical protein
MDGETGTDDIVYISTSGGHAGLFMMRESGIYLPRHFAKPKGSMPNAQPFVLSGLT